MNLFAVYLGGEAKGATLEVHDIAFAVGKKIEDTIPQLKRKWFGTKESLHIDSYLKLNVVDGHKITLGPNTTDLKLFFINIGSYAKTVFGENHHFFFLVAENKTEAKNRAKEMVAQKEELLPHADNLIEVDSLIPITEVEGHQIAVSKLTKDAKPSQVKNLYWPIK